VTLPSITLEIADEEEECAICQRTYGGENLAVMKLDSHHQVVGLADCRHVFGRACIEQVIRLTETDFVRCPLCRTQWCYVIGDEDVGIDPPGLIHYYTLRTALIGACDYTTVRKHLWAHPGYGPHVSQRSTSAFAIERKFRTDFRRSLESPEFVEKISKLREACKATLQNPGFDPWDPDVLLMVSIQNPLAFTNWHADIATITQACFHAICRSFRGRRILDTFYSVNGGKWLNQHDVCRKEEVLKAAKEEWRLVQDEGE
jgi:hypothetical protein